MSATWEMSRGKLEERRKHLAPLACIEHMALDDSGKSEPGRRYGCACVT